MRIVIIVLVALLLVAGVGLFLWHYFDWNIELNALREELSAQEVSEKTSGWKTYRNTKYRYQISFPDEWEGVRGTVEEGKISEEGGIFTRDTSASSSEKYRNHLWSIWTSPSEGLSLEEYVEKYLDGNSQESSDRSPSILKKRNVAVSGVPAIEVAMLSTHRYLGRSGDIDVITLFLKDGAIFAIGMTTTLVEPEQVGIGYFSKYRYEVKPENLEIYDLMVSSFKFSE